MKLKVKYLAWRDGRPRWEPGPHLRAKGWKGRDLKDEAGDWLPLDAAINAAQKINAEVSDWRGRRGVSPPPEPRRSSARTVAHLWDNFERSAEFRALAPSTQSDYRNKAAFFLADFSSDGASAPVAAISRPQLRNWWNGMVDARGLHMAHGCVAVARLMLTHACNIGWRDDNPGYNLKLKTPPPRIVLWTPDEVAHVIAVGDAMGLHSAGDALILALHSSQRQGDVLTMPEWRIEERRIQVQQAKTGALVDAPMTPQLAARAAAIRERKRARDLVRLDTLIVRDDDGRPHDENSFSRIFRRVMLHAAEEMPSLRARAFVCTRKHRAASDTSPDAGRSWGRCWEPAGERANGIKPWRAGAGYAAGDVVLSLGRRFQDTRDTALTRLALARCDGQRIAAISGHTLEHINQVLRHYIVLQPEMADSAIALVIDWMEKNKVAY